METSFACPPSCRFSDSTVQRPAGNQCRCGPPPQQPPPPPQPPLRAISHIGASLPPVLEAKVENFLESFVEPQCGHLVPFQSLDRIRISASFSHFSQ
jgi:hypothetical protein